MRHSQPHPDELTPELILAIRAWAIAGEPLPSITPPNIVDLCDIALGHRFSPDERRFARIQLAQVYSEIDNFSVSTRLDPLGDVLEELTMWAEPRRFDDDQDPGEDTPDEKLVRAYMRWRALR